MPNRDTLNVNSDKENDIAYKNNDPLFVKDAISNRTVPQTPMDKLLKRTHSKTLSTAVFKDAQQSKENNNNNIKLNRLPLASKDNNNSRRSNSFILQNNKLVLNKQLSLLNNNQTSNKLRKYGSILGVNNNGNNTNKTLNPVKSLILKDIPDNGNENDDDDDDDDDNIITLNLKNALQSKKEPLLNQLKNAKKNSYSDSEEEEIGLFGKGNGLQKLISQSMNHKTKIEAEIIPEIETKSAAYPDLSYSPEGYIPFNNEDIKKLNTFKSPYSNLNVNDSLLADHNNNNNSGLLELENVGSSDDDDDNNLLNISNIQDGRGSRQTNDNETFIDFEIQPSYNDGLDANELENLLDI
ncbi:hypothetical protein TPHA_0A01780 [Tetrapisispora phaffii CBS 4417]|uniref:Securin n=1 Tax=Tetrapisispora phaffii (strain ATCC 24235 / CBS 4417 / NBRC 1672 / NRRL Y-8282 / UCD 70-5) TaxID=1071381 RepID=G8BMY3_TETPH|nr:hypothetical protein TPHA_0A01780 [Tetrapisispora phaffii CBS 4417]CCE61261.1 hypothetical protein TPHA_0A01780 [Tetrapisispora phaffii CBS 4417]